MRQGLIPGENVDRINVCAGLRELALCGYDDTHTSMVVQHALMRWERGEESQAERLAIDKNFYGIDLGSWLRILAAARADAERHHTTGGLQK